MRMVTGPVAAASRVIEIGPELGLGWTCAPVIHPTPAATSRSGPCHLSVSSSADSALAVPRGAVVQDGLTHVLFRRDPSDPNTVIRIEADVGANDGRWIVLKSGVMRGDEVVVDGAYELKLALQQAGPAAQGVHVHADGTFHDDH